MVEADEDDAEDERAEDAEQDAGNGADELVESGGRDEIDHGEREGTQGRAEGRRHYVNRRRTVS